MRYSVLDLCPVPEGSTAAQSIANTVDLARHAEDLGYHRHWMAEHHNMEGIASAATSVLIGHVAGATKRIRVGAGGIMLPNHAPLAIAEQFGTLATMYPDRIDLGLGRAPGGDMAVARALRRSLDQGEGFPQDVVELMTYLGDPQPGAAVRALPGEGTHVPVWMLGSSLFGAQLAAHLGLPYAFASHFAPAALDSALKIYRSRYVPTETNPKPRFMLAVNVFAADTEAEANYIRSSMTLAFAALRSGRPGKLPHPVEDVESLIGPQMNAFAQDLRRISAVGTPDMVRTQLAGLIETYQPDELILTGQIHDHTARKHSFQIAAEALQDLPQTAAA